MLRKLIWNSRTRSMTLDAMRHLPISRGKVMCASWGGKQYNCNPRAIAEMLVAKGWDKVYYAFDNPGNFVQQLMPKVNAVEMGSLDYYYHLATAEFIVFNIRMPRDLFPYKKKGQCYIQTQHGGHGIKKVEWDAADSLPEAYRQMAELDRQRTDLMLSDSDYWTHVYRTAYRYEGEVLEKGLPRNDIFFCDDRCRETLRQQIVKMVKETKHLQNDDCLGDMRLVIYAPTFRNDGSRDVYGFDVDRITEALTKRWGGRWFVLISSHPNMRDYYRDIYDFEHPSMVDVGQWPDINPLLVACDALITDYSSVEMDFSLTGRPVFQLIRDREKFDRGTYLDPRTLPFPYAEEDNQLAENIEHFDELRYRAELEQFNREVVGLHETGHAAEAVVEWMTERR